VRAEITKIWQTAVTQLGLKFTALRAPDFFGPGVLLSQLGEVVFSSLSKNGTAKFLVPIEQPHDFAYVPDIARAVCHLLEATDDAYGQVWHMPCAKTTTARELMTIGAAGLGVAPKVFSFPLWLLKILGVFLPLAKELYEMRFQWDRPYHVNAEKFRKRFLFEPTPFSESIVATALSFKKSTI
jgi:nucleoside-diphosphate-sugar epimerase